MRDDLCGAPSKGGAGMAPPLSGLVNRLKSGLTVAVLGAAIIGAIGAAPAEAHGRLGAAQGRCRLFVGPDTMNFTGYLPEASKNEFCEDIPSTGPMIMVLDAEQDELRDMAVEIRIVKDVGGEEKEAENLDAVTVAYAPPKHYRGGTINFEHDFPEAGYFVGIVTVTGDHGERWISRFPFSVGMTFMRDLPVYATLALGVIAAFAIYLFHFYRKPPATPSNIATAAAAFRPPPPLDPAPPAPTNDDLAPLEAKAEEDGDKSPEKKATDDDSDLDDHYKRQAAE